MVKLHEGQREAIRKLKTGSILCGGVGSGKSRTALAYYICSEVRKKTGAPLYIITTARKRDTKEWEEEMEPMGLEAAAVDSWNNIKKYVDVKGAFFIFDEQRVVGYGEWTKAFLKITKSNRWILLSATPGDTWMDYIPVFIANGFYRTKTEFIDEHVIPNPFSKYFSVKKYVNEGKLIRLRNDILVDIRFERNTVSHHENVFVDYDQQSYWTVANRRWNIYDNSPITNAGEYCYVLREIVNSDESRVIRLLNILKDHPKVIIFYNFDYELEILRDVEYPKGTLIAEWNGHKHEQIPNGKRWVYLVNYGAGSDGWNCTLTDTVVFYSQSYSYRTMIQAAGRIDRRNTPFHDLYYYHLVSTSPIDRAIMSALRRKKNFNVRHFVPEPKPDLQKLHSI